jgi:hypothetical protein
MKNTMNKLSAISHKTKPVINVKFLAYGLIGHLCLSPAYALGPSYEEDMARQHEQERQIMEENYRQDEEAAQMGQENEPEVYDDPMQTRLNLAIDMAKLAGLSAAKAETANSDPKFQRYQQGGWDFFQGKKNAAPGEYCTAFFAKKEGFVSLSDSGDGYKGAMMIFWGQDIPRPAGQTKVQVTLKQGKDAPQTVQALNLFKPGDKYGAIAFAVPSMEALLAGMEDTLNFELIMNSKTVAKVDWHSGLMARKKLEECVNAKK